MMKKLKRKGAAFGSLLLLFMALTVPVVAEEGQPVPSMTVGYNGKTMQASRGSFQWDNGKDPVSASTAGPLDDARQLTAFTRSGGVHSVGLSFSYRPESILAVRWSSDARGEPDSIPDSEVLKDGKLTLPADNKSYIYEVTAQWKEGTVYYAFEMAAHTGTLTPLDRLPKVYTAEMAAKNGDTVLSLNGAQNFEKLDLFVEKAARGIPGSVRLTVFGKDSGPTLYDLRYDGKKIHCLYDNTHDEMVNVARAGNRRMTSTIYDGISLETKPHSADSRVHALLMLESKAYPKGEQITGFPLPEVTMRTDKPVYERSVTNIQIKIINNSDQKITYGGDYAVEQLTNSGWKRLEGKGEFILVEFGLAPGKSNTEVIKLDTIFPKKSAQDGTYRVVKQITYDGESRQVAAEFEIGVSGGALKLDQPVKITATSGTGTKKAETILTRKGKVENRSPLTYAAAELMALNGIPASSGAGAAGKKIVLSVRYEDGGDLITIMESGHVQTMDGLYNSGDKELYKRMEQCILAAQKAEK